MIKGAGFISNPNHQKNEVFFVNNIQAPGDPAEVPAEVLSATTDTITVLPPHNADTGKVKVTILLSTASAQVEAAKQTKNRIFEKGEIVLQSPEGASLSFLQGATKEKLSISVFKRERTLVALPRYFYSSTIVQIMPFGARIEPGGKLIFPNKDGILNENTPRLFHFDQNKYGKDLGDFVDVGRATVSPDKKWVETDPGAIKETGYYFVSEKWPTTTIKGRVKRSDEKPVIRAIVISRGQFTYSDRNGDFKLPCVPVVRSGDPASVEITYLRPDGNVLSIERAGVEVKAVGVSNIGSELVLPSKAINNPPTIIAPANLTLRAGETRNFRFKVIDPETKKKLLVSVSGARFATVLSPGILWCKDYKLHLAPQANDVGEHTLILTAIDSFGARTLYKVSVKVIARSTKG